MPQDDGGEKFLEQKCSCRSLVSDFCDEFVELGCWRYGRVLPDQEAFKPPRVLVPKNKGSFVLICESPDLPKGA